MIHWHKALYLIDHGAALYFHHDWEKAEQFVASAFPAIRHHVLLPWADAIEEAAAALPGLLSPARFAEILEQVPDTWLPTARRAAYIDLLARRLSAASNFVQEAIRARAELV
jgi:hypothetical protein